ncbi:MAG: acyltransferase [Caulobacterales bacterium]|nr:acyltransferase [Caulobacterales bacterium]
MTRDSSHSVAHSGESGRGGALDALRFAAALLIVLYHFGAEAPVVLADLHPVFGRGYLATDFFLILSGFVLGRAYGGQILSGRVSLFGFVMKRLTRLWPAQLIVLAVMGLVVLVAKMAGDQPVHPANFTPLAFLMQALMVQAWGVAGGAGWNHPSWSLSALLVCYAAFPLIWRRVSRLTSPAALLALGLTAMMGADLICRVVFHHTLYDLDFSLGVVRAAPLFLLGVCIARMVELGAPSVAMARLLAALAFVAFLMLQIAGRVDLPSLVCIAVIVWGLGRLPVRHPSALVEQGAKLSFALFVTHALTGLLWFGALETLARRVALAPWLHWGLWALSLPAALVVAALFHRFVDEPVQGWLAKRRAPRCTEASAAA